MNKKIYKAIAILTVFISSPLFASESQSDLKLFDQAELFKNKNPDEASYYHVLAPTSLEYIKHARHENHSFTKGLIGGIRARLDSKEDLADFLDRFEEINEMGREDANAFSKKMAAKLNDTDRLFFFRYRKEGYRDYGLLVIREGEIVYREWWEKTRMSGTDYPDESEIAFDNL